MDDKEQMVQELVGRGQDMLNKVVNLVPFTPDSEANSLVNDLDDHPHAFVLACLMDRQIKAERAWQIPHDFMERTGSFDFGDLKVMSLKEVMAAFEMSPQLHRYSEIMAKVFFDGVRLIADRYQGDASSLWSDNPTSAGLVSRFLEFNGAGPKIATMATNILVREFKVTVSDKYSIDISVDVHTKRVFKRLGLARQDASNEEIIYVARDLNPEYPGVFDLPAWEVGRNWCHPRAPECADCFMLKLCPTSAHQIDTRG